MSDYSVLMSVYFKEKADFLQKSIDSMLAQTVQPEQIVLVKDGVLTAELDAVINGYADEYPNIFTVVALEKNGGLGNALNIGLEHCRNELVARMDTDDISLPTRCEKQLLCFREDDDLDIVGTQINEFESDPTVLLSSRVVPEKHEEIMLFSGRRSPFNHPTVMYKKSTVLKNNGYTTYGRKEDIDLFIRMLHNGAKAKNINEALLLYRSNADNLKRRKGFANCKEYISIIYGFYKKGYSSLSDLIYVICGQTAMFLMPCWFVKLLNDRVLRKKPIEGAKKTKELQKR